jgi:hypothetical protein
LESPNCQPSTDAMKQRQGPIKVPSSSHVKSRDLTLLSND